MVLLVSLSVLVLPTASLDCQTALMPLQKGMCYVTWDKDRFASEYSDKSLEKLSKLGVEYISLCVTHYQEKYNSTDIIRTDKTPSKRSLAHVIKKAHKLGMKVMLKPHIDLIDKYDGTYWRADIGFACEQDWEKWFREYERFILEYASMSRRLGVELLCVGTELSFTTQKDPEWRRIISRVRKIYKGELVYAANWDNFKNINFWEELDYVGIDAYFPLTYSPSPTKEDLKKGWEKWKNDIESWQKLVNKPVIFTEIGYPSTSHAPYTPWKGGTHGNADPDIQAECYRAFFDTMWEKEWLAGIYWWKWDTNVHAGGKYNRQFTPQNKPAQEVLESYYRTRNRQTHYAMRKTRD
ncbi:MAG: hypothetical protein GF409_03305 [Candidatus Omnitrophica bacterium]|nr:hypothetical protein [Candidatus Omnitrophota bacterium]